MTHLCLIKKKNARAHPVIPQPKQLSRPPTSWRLDRCFAAAATYIITASGRGRGGSTVTPIFIRGLMKLRSADEQNRFLSSDCVRSVMRRQRARLVLLSCEVEYISGCGPCSARPSHFHSETAWNETFRLRYTQPVSQSGAPYTKPRAVSRVFWHFI